MSTDHFTIFFLISDDPAPPYTFISIAKHVIDHLILVVIVIVVKTQGAHTYSVDRYWPKILISPSEPTTPSIRLHILTLSSSNVAIVGTEGKMVRTVSYELGHRIFERSPRLAIDFPAIITAESRV